VDPATYLDDVGVLIAALGARGFHPVLVGGMALVTLGSRRVTRDFDFLIAHPGDRLDDLVSACYAHGLELASRLDEAGEVTATIDNPKMAGLRLRIDRPRMAFFVHPKTRLRVDLLFDFPLPAAPIAARAQRLRIASHRLRIAAEPDLLALKKLALTARDRPGDADDVAFLEARRRTRGR
jgi:hypothetical protein